jgi:glycosidase
MFTDLFETKYYGDVGFLYLYDIHYDPDDRAFCNPLPDGRVQFRLRTPHNFAEANLVYNDSVPQGAEMHVYARDSRFLYWETAIRPQRPLVVYSFALRTTGGKIIYHCKHGVDHAVEPLDRWQLDLEQVEPFETPAWMHGAVMYHIFPERFANGNPANDPPGSVPWGSPPDWLEFQGGDLQGITQHLDYLQELGVEVVYVNPINVSPSTHKFDAVDYYHVDPAFGGDEALRALVEGLHERRMYLIVDASFNHCHPRFFAFQDVIEKGPDSPYWDWFTIYEYPIHVNYRPHLLSEEKARDYARYLEWFESFPERTGIPVREVDGEGLVVEPSYLAWYGVLDMPKLDLTNPETRAYFLDVAAHWLEEFHIDGWRMDVARHIVPDFWVDFRRVTKEVRPDCFLLAEIWGNTSPWLQGDQFDATMNYIFRDLCVDYFAQGEMDTVTFLDGVTRMLSLYAPQVVAVTHNLLSSHDVQRFLYASGERIRRMRLATVFQMTIPGAPGIYYGDEIGMTGGDDPDNRRAFPWQEPESWDRETLALMRELVALRRAHPALRYGDWKLVWSSEQAFAYERTYEGERLVVLINRGEALERVTLPVALDAPQVVWGEARVSGGEEGIVVEGVEAWRGVILG